LTEPCRKQAYERRAVNTLAAGMVCTKHNLLLSKGQQHQQLHGRKQKGKRGGALAKRGEPRWLLARQKLRVG
jgi:hypothetical protein